MKKNFLFLLITIVIAIFSCKKEVAEQPSSIEGIAGTANHASAKIEVCHYDAKTGIWQTKSINISAWPAHQAHGDVRLDDQDGDGYVPNNACGFGMQGDCDDNNSSINPGATEICGNGIDENCNGQIDENCLVIVGADYQGGKIAYILQPGDPGYDPNVLHGLIAAPTDQSTGIEWGCYGYAISGADGTALGTGNQNTIDIEEGCPIAGIAANLCGDLELNGYDDWYLPSQDELEKLYLNRVAIGSFADTEYWSSSESNFNSTETDWARSMHFAVGVMGYSFKSSDRRVRAIRAF